MVKILMAALDEPCGRLAFAFMLGREQVGQEAQNAMEVIAVAAAEDGDHG